MADDGHQHQTCLSAMLQMAWEHGYRSGNPVNGIRLKHPPSKPIVVATPQQFPLSSVGDSVPEVSPELLVASLRTFVCLRFFVPVRIKDRRNPDNLSSRWASHPVE